MNFTTQLNIQQRIVNVASAGFLLYGYHGYSMQACAEAVGLTTSGLRKYAGNKVELAHHIMQSLVIGARHAICTHQCPFSLGNGLQLALLPATLRVTNDKVINHKICSYYDDWRLAFIDNAFSCNECCHQGMYPPGNRGFLMWLGYWMTQQIGLSGIEVEVPKWNKSDENSTQF